MSLINQMLTDLEMRQADIKKDQATILKSIEFSDDFVCKTNNTRHSNIGVFIIISCIVIAGITITNHFLDAGFVNNIYRNLSRADVRLSVQSEGISELNLDEPAEIVSDVPEEQKHNISENTMLNDEIEIEPNILPVDLEFSTLQVKTQISSALQKTTETSINDKLKPEQLTGKLNHIDNLVLDGGTNGSRILLSFSSDPVYSVFTLEQPDRLVLKLQGNYEPMDDSLMQQTGISRLKNIRDEQKENEYVVTFEFDSQPLLKNTEILQIEQQTELVIHLSEQQQSLGDASELSTTNNNTYETVQQQLADEVNDIVDVTVTQQSVKVDKIVHKQDKVKVARDYNTEGLAEYKQGNITDSIELLYLAVNTDPKNSQARTLLASILLEQGDISTAQSLLTDGLAINPKHATMAKLQAQILANEGNNKLALYYLQRALPALEDDVEYHAFLAALLQRENRHIEAIAVYRNVLARNSSNGLWWMGLGISLEASGWKQQALSAYIKASQDQNITLDISRYLNGRISHLNTQQAS